MVDRSPPSWILLSAVTGLLFACSTAPTLELAAAPASFDRGLVSKGAELAAIGNCVTCHTAPGGKAYAGGFPIKTPFGTVYGTNITPDPQTGIGGWSLEAFTRAMREGVDREGRHLYPAFPYEYFTRLGDEDIRALYAFVMTREPVRSETPANSVIVPRFAVAFWKARYFDRAAFKVDTGRDAEWNRGAYLVAALAHCSACHTPRNRLGAEEKGEFMSGGEVGGWHAPALNASSPSPVPWDVESLSGYLRTGIVEAHAITAGPMVPVVDNLARVSAREVRAIAAYTVSLDTRPAQQRDRQSRQALAQPPFRPPAQGDRALREGAVIYAGACGDCHDRGRQAEGGALPLPLAIGLTIPTPRNLIHIVRDGIVPQAHETQPWMPEFKGALTEAQIADLVVYLRTLADQPPWPDVPGEVRKISRGGE